MVSFVKQSWQDTIHKKKTKKTNTQHKARFSKKKQKTQKNKKLNSPLVSNKCLCVFVNMLYGDATRDLSCSLWNMLDGTSHNRDEEPSGIQVSACLLQTLLKKKNNNNPKKSRKLKKNFHTQQMLFK